MSHWAIIEALRAAGVEPWQVGVLASCTGSLLGTLGVQFRILADTVLVTPGEQEDGVTSCSEDSSGGPKSSADAIEDFEAQTAASSASSSASASSATCALSWRKAWLLRLIGWQIWFDGQALNQVAILLAPATIAACVTFSCSILANTLLAPVVLNEQLTRAHGWGVVLLVAGGSSVTATAAHTTRFSYSPEEFLAMFMRVPFVLSASLAVATAIFLGVRALKQSFLDAWSFAYLYALNGTLLLLLTKSFYVMLAHWLVDPEAFDAAPLWLLGSLGGTVFVLNVTLMVCQVASTRYGDTLQNMPLFLSSGAMMQVSLCGTFFNEFSAFSSARLAVFLLGFILMLAGLIVTSRAGAAAPPRPLPHALNEPLLQADCGASIRSPAPLPAEPPAAAAAASDAAKVGADQVGPSLPGCPGSPTSRPPHASPCFACCRERDR